MSVFIIAEAGVNHNGDLALAKQLIDVAVAAGADAVKFQTFKAEKLVIAGAEKAAYQIRNTGTHETQAQMLKKLELPYEAHADLMQYCDRHAIMFMSSPFDIDSILFLNNLGLSVFKIPSGEITSLPYLKAMGALKKRIVMSTGMANMDEVRTAVKVLTDSGTPKDQITVLHCHTDYPTAMKDVNLRAILTIKNELGVQVGYSDHTAGIEVPIAAVALGASVIEKHFTLDKNMEGPDHKASLDPKELEEMVKAIRNIEQALGDGLKKPTVKEIEIATVARKSIVAARDIKAGEILNENNLTIKRPGTGISPMEWDSIIGTMAERDFQVDDLIVRGS